MDRLGRCHVIAVGAESAWGKTILSPSLEKHGVFNSELFLPLDRPRYVEKLSRIGLDCPYGVCDWTNDSTEWPEVLFPD